MKDNNMQPAVQDNQQSDISDDLDEKMDIQIPEEAKKFLGAILDETGLSLTDEVREEMILQLFVKLDALMLGRIIDSLPDDKVDAFMDLQEKNATPQEIQGFIDENLPNAKDVFATTFAEFRDTYLANVDIAQAEKDLKDSTQASVKKDPLEEIAAGKHSSMQ